MLKQEFITFSCSHMNSSADLAVENKGRIYKVQVKSCNPVNNKMRIDIRKSHGETRNYSEGDFDILAAVNQITNGVAFFPFNVLASTQITVWVKPPATTNGFKQNDRMIVFDDYLKLQDAIDALNEKEVI